MKNKKILRPHKCCLTLLAASAAVLLVGQCFLRVGFPRDGIRLNVQEGDISQLQAFDLHGVWRQDEDTVLDFALGEPGVTVTPRLQGETSESLPLWLQRTFCVPDEEIPMVDSQADSGATRGYRGAFFLRFPYSGVQYTAMSDHVELVYTVSVTDGSNRSVRFSLGKFQLPRQETVTAQLYDGQRVEESHSYLIVNTWMEEEMEVQFPELTAISSRDQVLLYVTPYGETPGGLYTIEEFVPNDQAAQQVSKVQIHGMELPSLTQPYGKVEETCTFEPGEKLAECRGWDYARLENERQWLVTCDDENQLYLRIVNAEGKPVVRLPLNLAAEEEQAVTVLPAMRTDEAVFTVTEENGGKAVVLRIKDDAVTVANVWDLAAEDVLLTAGFNEDGAELMTVYEKREDLSGTVPPSVQQYYNGKTESGNLDCTVPLATGWQIRISSVSDPVEPVFEADLDFGIPQQGRETVWGKGIYETYFSPSQAFCRVSEVWQRVKEDVP